MSSARGEPGTSDPRQARPTIGPSGSRLILSALSVALLLPGGCGREDPGPGSSALPPTVDVEEIRSEPPGGRPARPPRDARGIAFRAAGSFPHGEHRRIECSACHGDVSGHGSHETVACTGCHGTPVDYASLPVRSESECMGCHHDAARTGLCLSCHEEAPPGTIRVEAAFSVSAAPEPRSRELGFEHGRHRELECKSCHERPPLFQATRACASCHQEHHVPEARCAGCHRDVMEAHRGEEVHEGCGGAGCHDDPVTASLPPNRETCLTCHVDQADHEPGGRCATCHLDPAPRSAITDTPYGVGGRSR